MTPQIIGTKKSSSYRACVRYCKERGIPFQERDLREKPFSPMELDRVAATCGGHQELIDTAGKAFQSRGLAWMDYDARTELLEHPELLRHPIVRTDNGAAIDPDSATLDTLFR
jgi:arsenate reductase (glutaredoxin)